MTTADEVKPEQGDGRICSICKSPVDLQREGGIVGFFGVCPVAFCVWCYASLVDMVRQGCARCHDDGDDYDGDDYDDDYGNDEGRTIN